jgi:myosin heavy subunit
MDAAFTGTNESYTTSGPKGDRDCFTVKHYAGPVKYNVNGFCERSLNFISPGIKAALRESKSAMVRDASTQRFAQGLGNVATKQGQTKKVNTGEKPTVGVSFAFELSDLIKTIEGTNAHYVRCIKVFAQHTQSHAAAYNGQWLLLALANAFTKMPPRLHSPTQRPRLPHGTRSSASTS